MKNRLLILIACCAVIAASISISSNVNAASPTSKLATLATIPGFTFDNTGGFQYEQLTTGLNETWITAFTVPAGRTLKIKDAWLGVYSVWGGVEGGASTSRIHLRIVRAASGVAVSLGQFDGSFDEGLSFPASPFILAAGDELQVWHERTPSSNTAGTEDWAIIMGEWE